MPEHVIEGAAEGTKYHVVPDPRGGWQVKVEGQPMAAKHFKLKVKAVAYARRLSRRMASRRDSQRVIAPVVHNRRGLTYRVIRGGKVAKFDPVEKSLGRHFGSAKGIVRIRDDFDETPEDFAAYMR